MRRLALAFVVVLMACLIATPVSAQTCVKIQSGSLVAGDGVTSLKTGFDEYGYNYQAHMFNGLYDNYRRPTTPVTTGDVKLVMKWSDEWIANVSCDGDAKLDRGLDIKAPLVPGMNPTGGSRGWVTNHLEGDCLNADTQELEHYTYFVKIVWVGPATVTPDPWEGKRIWGVYAIIEEVSNNAPLGDDNICSGTTGGDRTKLVNPAGLGFYK